MFSKTNVLNYTFLPQTYKHILLVLCALSTFHYASLVDGSSQLNSGAASTPTTGSSSTSVSSSSSSSSQSANKYQARSDSISNIISPSSSGSSGSSSSYYTNDLSSFISGNGQSSSSVKPELRQQQNINSVSGSSSSLGIPYQALLQALANAQSVPSNSASSPSASATSASNALSTLLSSSASPSLLLTNSYPSYFSPASWVNLSGGNSLFSMLKPSQIGGRRSSLTSRLRNFMNALFYR